MQIQLKVINHLDYKETHGLFINGQLHYTGTENECAFAQLKLIQECRQKQKETRPLSSER